MMDPSTTQLNQPLKISDVLAGGTALKQGAADEVLPELLRAIRSHLGMEVSFVSEFTKGQLVIRHVNAAGVFCPVHVGQGEPLEQSLCQRVVDGRVPTLIQNAQDLPEALSLPATSALPIGAYLSIPIRLHDGSLYGTFCCFSRKADYSLNERDLALMRVFADLTATIIERDQRESREAEEKRRRIESLLHGDGMSMVYQPICDLKSHRVVGFESLARFTGLPVRGPDSWFDEAASVGLGEELETRAIHAALAFDRLGPDVYLSCNASPQVVLQRRIAELFDHVPLDRIVLEITEHATIGDYAAIARELEPLRARGLRLAVDDAGAGYASFRHILKLRPDFIKLDISLTHDIDTDLGRRALAASLIGFARETQSELIAEGVETPAELATLCELGVRKAQGFFLGRPMPREAAQELVSSAVVHA